MKRTWFRAPGIGMLLAAIGFRRYALGHPEASFPWSNRVSCFLHGGYLAVAALPLVVPSQKK